MFSLSPRNLITIAKRKLKIRVLSQMINLLIKTTSMMRKRSFSEQSFKVDIDLENN